MDKEYVVIGLGRFGGSIVRELNALDMDVMAIDRDENRVNEYSDIATHAVVADTTDEAVMKSLGIRNFDHVIVAIGENIQSSTLTTLILKELGVKKVTAKAQNDYHAKIKIVTASPKITINFKYNDMSIEMITTTITVKNIFLRRCALCLEITLRFIRSDDNLSSN